MGNLATTLALQSLGKKSRVTRSVRYSTSAPVDRIDSYFYIRMPLAKISLSASTRCESHMVIIERNRERVGRTASNFVPKFAILTGHNRVAERKADGELFIDVWAGKAVLKNLDIQADDAIGVNALSAKLQALLDKQFPPTSNVPSSAWIVEVYPFENYLIYNKAGQTYKQRFVLDPVLQVVAFSDNPEKVYQEYVTTPKGLTTREGAKATLAENIIQSSAALPILPSDSSAAYYTTTMSQELEFDTVNSDGKPLGMHPGSGVASYETIQNYGAPTSEYAQPLLKSMMNIEEALSMYLSMIKNGTHTPLPPLINPGISASRYPNEYREAEIAARAVGAEISVLDFMGWQNKQLSASTKTKLGLEASAFAYIGDKEDPSTWHCAKHTVEAAKESIKNLSSSYVPKDSRAEVKAALQAALGNAEVPGGTARVAAKKKVEAAGNPNSGKKKFKIGDKVTTPHGTGFVSDNPSKDSVEVRHTDNKTKTFHSKHVNKFKN